MNVLFAFMMFHKYSQAETRPTVGAGHAGARTKVFRTRELLGRGQHPQEVRRGCKGLKPQQHTAGPAPTRLTHCKDKLNEVNGFHFRVGAA